MFAVIEWKYGWAYKDVPKKVKVIRKFKKMESAIRFADKKNKKANEILFAAVTVLEE